MKITQPNKIDGTGTKTVVPFLLCYRISNGAIEFYSPMNQCNPNMK